MPNTLLRCAPALSLRGAPKGRRGNPLGNPGIPPSPPYVLLRYAVEEIASSLRRLAPRNDKDEDDMQKEGYPEQGNGRGDPLWSPNRPIPRPYKKAKGLVPSHRVYDALRLTLRGVPQTQRGNPLGYSEMSLTVRNTLLRCASTLSLRGAPKGRRGNPLGNPTMATHNGAGRMPTLPCICRSVDMLNIEGHGQTFLGTELFAEGTGLILICDKTNVPFRKNGRGHC